MQVQLLTITASAPRTDSEAVTRREVAVTSFLVLFAMHVSLNLTQLYKPVRNAEQSIPSNPCVNSDRYWISRPMLA